MNHTKDSGFQEISHTADVSVRVWAPDFNRLLVQAALGMYALMGARRGEGQPTRRALSLPAGDAEEVLVNFLSELLYALESEGCIFERFAFHGSLADGLSVSLEGGQVAVPVKEIKAVTFNDLKIIPVNDRLETTIVFDV